MLNIKSIPLVIGVFGLVLAVSTNAQSQVSMEQARAECRSASEQQTGYNPNAATTAAQPQTGGRARGAAAGAMVGAAQGQNQNQRQDAAKAGAAVGASRQRQSRRQDAAAGQQAEASAQAYNQAYSSCMLAKGFPGQ